MCLPSSAYTALGVAGNLGNSYSRRCSASATDHIRRPGFTLVVMMPVANGLASHRIKFGLNAHTIGVDGTDFI